MLLRLLMFTILSFSLGASFGQSKSKLQGKGEKLLGNEEFEEMIAYVSSLGEDAKDDPFYNYYLGMSYFYTADKKVESTPYLENYISETDTSLITLYGHQHIYYMLATMYHLTYRFDDAQAMFRKFIQSIENVDDIPLMDKATIIADAKRQIEHCEFGKIQVKNPRNVLIESLGDSINTKYPEYASVVSQDESTLIFTSRRPDTRGGKKPKEGGGYYEDIYSAKLVKGSLSENQNLLADTTRGQYFHLATDFEYREFRRMNDEVNSKDHDGSIQFGDDDKTLYFYRDADIWKVGIQTDSVSEAQKMGVHVNSNYHEPSIFFSYSGTKLFIVSDRPGGYGGLDIYFSEHIGGDEWSPPINLGPNINTEYDEDAPYLDPDEMTLYFSSKGHSSMGGFDIFRSKVADTSWSVPVNIGFPVNTPADDIYFTMTERYNRGYYASSDLSGKGAMDLYRITFTDERDPVAELFGVVKDEKGVALEALITLTSADGESITTRTNGKDGGFFLLLGHGKSYHVVIDVEGFTPYSVNFEVPELKEYVQFYQEVHLRHIKDQNGENIGQEITLYNSFGEKHNDTYSPQDEAIINNIENGRTIIGNIRVLKQIQFYFDHPPLEKMVEDELIFDLNIEDFVYVLKEEGMDINNPDSYVLYSGPLNREEWERIHLANAEVDPDTPEGTINAGTIDGLYFTVQIGVYSRDVEKSVLYNLNPIVTLKVQDKFYRYSTGTFMDQEEAALRKDKIVDIGITDAFVTAYYQGERITIERAQSLIAEHGLSIFKQ
jgi:WD40-like Beta Propeller Repeat